MDSVMNPGNSTMVEQPFNNYFDKSFTFNAEPGQHLDITAEQAFNSKLPIEANIPFVRYNGNSIFRNQPSYTHFNRRTDELKDVLNLELNEIDAAFLTESESGFEQQSTQVWDPCVDPRTKEIPKNSFLDFTGQRRKQKIFHGAGIKSTLTKAQHVIGLRVLTAWQEYEEVKDDDIVNYRRMKLKLEKEREEMRTYLSKFAEHHKDKLYAPAKRLDVLYRNWYRRKTEQLLKQHAQNQSFNTHTGLPHVSVCRSINEERAELVDVKLIARSGWMRLHQSEYDWQNFNLRLNIYAEEYNDHLCCEKTKFEKEINNELEEFDERINGRNFYIPFETILFLLTAGDYVDLPTEVLLEIRHGPTEDEKIVVFDTPLPARNCGWHTQQRVIEQAFTEFVAAEGRCKWKCVDEEKRKMENLELCEINAVPASPIEFRPLSFNEFVAKNEAEFKQKQQNKNSNESLVEWHLKNNQLDCDMKILTILNTSPAGAENISMCLPYESLKLEYKPDFGCELMSKYELLRAWLQMQLMSFTERSHHGVCYRLSVHDCELQLDEKLTLESIELNLKKDYFVDTKQLFSNLAEFLKLLSNMVTGKYLLRYNSKYKDKFLLCAPTQEITQNTVFLHDLLKTEPTNVAFMTQHYFLPISESLCSVVHKYHKVLPCAFLPKERHQKNLEFFSVKMKKKAKSPFKAKSATTNSAKAAENSQQVNKSKKRKRKNNQKRAAQQLKALQSKELDIGNP